ncbi:2'-5' RNA ligase family protein [Solwaraspora sp. WMMD406]|uniref:2'-5' RNA ligase family protein n=1 Tax=Solwaraspora sp. WMMD406 TaxID=3016095 RepID=UPI0024168810|nr:2'-5' RNA ligase family protein [Solwaraspora sp. WMMD406]MDG4768050.1 2'-5' RNA ligase family protein [Solwaraspora sp. WMMD406]
MAAAIGPAPAPGWVRIGVAVDVPQPWGELLTRRRAEAGDPAAQYFPAHVTLLSPTDIVADRLPQVEAHLAAVAATHPPYLLQLCGTGTFRPITEVVFVAVAAGFTECQMLASAIRAARELTLETRYGYHPHVTVAQDVSAAALDKVYDDLAGFEARFDVAAFTLFSHTGVGRWRPRREFALTGRSAGRPIG